MARARFIQCMTPFKGGTKMKYGGVEYHFAPNELGDFVAEIVNDQHYDAILSIGAGFQPYGNATAAAAAVQARVDADSAVRKASAARAEPKTDRMAAVRAAKAAKKQAAAAE